MAQGQTIKKKGYPMNREKSAYFVAIFGLPEGITDTHVKGGVNKFETKSELNAWISENLVTAHTWEPHKANGFGILPDGRAVQIFHGRIKGLISKVEIG
jgi:hypothetical protein